MLPRKTIAEVLSDAGYDTAMWGKWHMGDLPEHAPENRYDYAYYGLFNGAADGWPTASNFYERNMPQPVTPAWYDYPGKDNTKTPPGSISTSPAMSARRARGAS